MIHHIARAMGGIVLSLTVAGGLSPPSVHAQPRITEASPRHGDVLQTLPEVFHLCFDEPIKSEDSTDWKFNVRTPDGRALGLRIEFQSGGGCVDVFPGAPEEIPQGIWAFDWLVHAQNDDSEGSGTVNFQLGELQAGETPLEAPSSNGGTDESDTGSSVPLGLYVAIGGGIALIAAAGAGFALNRRRGA